MKLSDLPSYLNIPAAQLAKLAGVSKQNLDAYLKGRIGSSRSTFIGRILQAAGFSREEIYFPNPEGYTDDRPEYWALIEQEARNEKEKRHGKVR